ncbi:MAG: hypothetical protein ACK5XV_09275 [Flavobacteriales bacterium]|jgi:hypothetical protein
MKGSPVYILGGFMVVVLTVTGIVALCTNALSNVLAPPRNHLFGAVLLLYALVRFSRLRRQFNRDKFNRT